MLCGWVKWRRNPISEMRPLKCDEKMEPPIDADERRWVVWFFYDEIVQYVYAGTPCIHVFIGVHRRFLLFCHATEV